MKQITGALVGIALVLSGGLRPHGLLRRLGGRHLPAVLHHHRLLHGALGAGGPDAHPGALRHHAQAGREGAPGVQPRLLRLVQPDLRARRRRLPADGGRAAQAAPGRPGRLRRGPGDPGGALRPAPLRLPAAGGPGEHERAHGTAARQHHGADSAGAGARHRPPPDAGEGGHRDGHGRGRDQLRLPRPERRRGLRPPEALGRARRRPAARRRGGGAGAEGGGGLQGGQRLRGDAAGRLRARQRQRLRAAAPGPGRAGPRRPHGGPQPAPRPGPQGPAARQGARQRPGGHPPVQLRRGPGARPRRWASRWPT